MYKIKTKARIWYDGRLYQPGKVYEVDEDFVKAVGEKYLDIIEKPKPVKEVKKKKDKMIRRAKETK